MKYKVVEVMADSDHEMAGRVEGESKLFVVSEDGVFYPCDEFFYMVSISSFETLEA